MLEQGPANEPTQSLNRTPHAWQAPSTLAGLRRRRVPGSAVCSEPVRPAGLRLLVATGSSASVSVPRLIAAARARRTTPMSTDAGQS